jgi:hypothetical protein
MIVSQIVSYINLEKIRKANKKSGNDVEKLEAFKQVVLDECTHQELELKVEIQEQYKY